MAVAVQDVAWETCLLEPVPDRALEVYARRKIGVPHPSIHVRKITSTDIAFGTSRAIYIDGEHAATAPAMRIECHREALRAYV